MIKEFDDKRRKAALDGGRDFGSQGTGVVYQITDDRFKPRGVDGGGWAKGAEFMHKQ